MWHYPEFDPVAISLGPISVHWYALSYLIGICFVWWHVGFRSRKFNLGWNEEQISDMIFYGVFGVILGGRIGYMLFYGHQQLIDDPLSIFKLWQGGMSFHGGLIGVAIAIFTYGRKNKVSFLGLADFVVPLVPAGLFFGRIGNFIGGELYGRATEVPWAMVFPSDPTQLTRHPSQLYEALLEGLVIFLVINWYARKPRLFGEVSGLFLILYGLFRFLVEFVREPDAHLVDQSALIESLSWMTRGQVLCVPMMLLGLWLLRKTFQRLAGNPN